MRFRPPAVTLIDGVLSGGVLSGDGVLSGGVLSGGGVGDGVLSVVTDAYNVIAFVNLSMYFLVLAAHFSAS